MVRYVNATYAGSDDTYFTFKIGHSYPLAVKTRWWSSKVSVYQRHGYYDEMTFGTLHHFSNLDMFNNCWLIKEDSPWQE
jgi:hypothetical protein